MIYGRKIHDINMDTWFIKYIYHGTTGLVPISRLLVDYNHQLVDYTISLLTLVVPALV